MKCAVLGGGGFIGSAIVDRMLKDEHEIRIFERPRVEPYRRFAPHERVEWITGDSSSDHDLGEVVRGVDMVLHLISTTLPQSSNDDPLYDVKSNLVPTLQLLNAAVTHKVKRIVFISSGGTVYGKPEYSPIDERHPTEPLVSYGITKLAIEKYLLSFQRLHGIRTIILRVANAFGERQRIESVQGAVGVFLHRALTKQPIEIWGDGSAIRDYVYVQDVAEAFAKAVSYAGDESVFNVSSGQGTSLNEIIAAIEHATGLSVERRHLPKRPFDVATSVLSNALAREHLGWVPRVSLQEGIARTVAWMRASKV